MKPIRKHTFQTTPTSITALPMVLLALLLTPLTAFSASMTMEDSAMLLMETAVSRTANNSNYERPVDFQRDSQFNATKSAQPGWMLNATAIGNLINVQVKGAGNTVLVNAVQMNSGNQMSVISNSPSSYSGSRTGDANTANSNANTNSSAATQTTQASQSTTTPTSSISGTYGK